MFFFCEDSMFRYGFALLIATTATFGAAAASDGRAFDGRWSVVIQTEKGDCDAAYRYGLSIQNGNVTYAGDDAFEVRGRVSHNGKVHVRVARGASYADGRGRLSRDTGSGQWTGAGGGACSGRWFAERRGEQTH
jgi:hypothetical protein